MRVSPFRDTLKLLKNVPKQTGAIIYKVQTEFLNYATPLAP